MSPGRVVRGGESIAPGWPVAASSGPPEVVIGYALNRRPDQGEFAHRDVEILNTLSAHLALRRLGDELADATHVADVGLTPRQTEVAVVLARTGGTNAQLARSLQISEGTVKKHLESVFRVLGIDSRSAAVAALRAMTE